MRPIYLVMLAFFIASCGSSEQKNTVEEPAMDTGYAIPFSGLWVSQNYIDTLLKTRSARASQQAALFLDIHSNTNGIGENFDYHEGNGQVVIVMGGSNFFMKYDETDSVLITIVDKRKIKVGDKAFTSVIKMTDDGLDLKLPEHWVYKGVYSCGDSSVQLYDDGRVEGLGNIKYYQVNNDYAGFWVDEGDLVFLSSKRAAMSSMPVYCSRFVDDTLFIYNVECAEKDGDFCVSYRRTDVKYKLVKRL